MSKAKGEAKPRKKATSKKAMKPGSTAKRNDKGSTKEQATGQEGLPVTFEADESN